MDLIIKAFWKAAEFFGLQVPDVVNHDMSSEVEETSGERKSRFKELVHAEEDIKDEVASNECYVLDDDWEDDEEVA